MFLSKIFSGIEKTNMTLTGWFTAFLGIVFIRAVLENFVGLGAEASMTSSSQTLIHFFTFWITTTLGLILVVHLFTKKDIVTVSKISLFGLMTILLAPILEFLMSSGQGTQMAYLIVNSSGELISNFFTFWQTSPSPGVTTGMRIEIFLILMGLFMYARYAGISRIKSLLTVFGVYIVVFITLALPSFIDFEPTFSSFTLMKNSLLGQSFLHPDVGMISPKFDYEIHFDGVLSQVLYLILIPLGFMTAYRWSPSKVIAIFKNSRPERVFHYFAAITFGILLAYREGFGPIFFGHWLDFTTVVILFISFYFAWMFSVGQNDIVDSDADSLTNSNRPLVTGLMTVTDMENSNFIFFVMALLGAYLVGPEALFMMFVFLSSYHIYSCPPLHLKRFAIINSSLVSLATLSAVMAGFFVFNGDARMESFPTHWIVLILVLFTLFLNIKDIKDIEGDKKYGVYTIPVIFGEKIGKILIWAMLAAGLVIFPIALGNNLFWMPSIIAIVASWFIVHRRPYVERYFFYLFFPYFIYFVYIYLL